MTHVILLTICVMIPEVVFVLVGKTEAGDTFIEPRSDVHAKGRCPHCSGVDRGQVLQRLFYHSPTQICTCVTISNTCISRVASCEDQQLTCTFYRRRGNLLVFHISKHLLFTREPTVQKLRSQQWNLFLKMKGQFVRNLENNILFTIPTVVQCSNLPFCVTIPQTIDDSNYLW